MRKKVVVDDKMQSGYAYYLTEPVGKNFNNKFQPELIPSDMLSLGVFGGKYMTDCQAEFPDSWYEKAKLDSRKHDPDKNYFGVNASQPLSVWREKGWINEKHDPRGWFQWYCRYYLGRRLDQEDQRQIKRWRSYQRHKAQVVKNCKKQDYDCRKKQRQSLLHWAYDSRKY